MTAARTLTFTVTQEMIDRWAAVSGDHNLLHVSPDYARGTPFGSTIAHGHLSLAYIERLMVELVGVHWLHGGSLRGIRFRAPVRPAQRYEVTASAHAESEDGDGQQWTVEIRDSIDGTVCVTGAAVLPSVAIDG